MAESKVTEKPIEIDPTDLSPEALAGIIESFILREGTDYGWVEISLQKKKEQVHTQIQKGLIKIIFDQSAESVSLVTEADFRRLMSGL